jgi:hypothetical protein
MVSGDKTDGVGDVRAWSNVGEVAADATATEDSCELLLDFDGLLQHYARGQFELARLPDQPDLKGRLVVDAHMCI